MPEQTVHQQRVDVAAGKHGHHGRLEGLRVVEHRGHSRGAGRFDDELGAFQAEQQRAGQRLLGDRADVRHDLGDHRERDGTGLGDGDAVGHRGDAVERDRVPGRHRPGVGRGAGGLDPDDADVGSVGERGRDAGQQPAAAGRHDHGADVGDLVEDLQPDRPLAGDDVRVIEGVDQNGAGLLGQRGRRQERLLDAGPDQPHRRAVALGGRDLRQRRPDRHHHRGRGAQQRGRQGDALRVVARAGGHHARPAPALAETGDPHVGAAELERAAALEVLALEPDLAAAALGQDAGPDDGCDPGDLGQQLGRRPDVGERDGQSAELSLRHARSVAPGGSARGGRHDGMGAPAGNPAAA